MLSRRLTSRILQARYPYYLLEDDIQGSDSLYFLEPVLLSQLQALLRSLDKEEKNKGSSMQLNSLEVIKLVEIDQSPSESSARTKAAQFLNDFIKTDQYSFLCRKKKIKSASTERIEPEDLALFHRQQSLLKRMKKTVDKRISGSYLIIE